MNKKPNRILTGIQSTGIPHLGNILGAIVPAIDFSKQKNVETYLFIADFHSLTQIKNSELLKENTLHTAAAWLACGLDPEEVIFYRQSDNSQVNKMKRNYEMGGYGYGHAKKDLIKLILSKYSNERKKFNYYLSNPNEVEKILMSGALKARTTADKVLKRVRKKLGY